MTSIIDSNKTNFFSSEIGGKAKGLLFLKNNNYLTPPFFVLDFNTLSSILNKTIELDEILSKWVDDNNIDEKAIWAVRSSADNEDGTTQSFAGIFKTEINVKTTDLKSAIWGVLQSYSILKTQKYTLQEKAEFGIIIQEMIRSEYSGIVFSHDPNNIRDETIHINIIPGIGENLVSGREEAFSVTYSDSKFTYTNSDDYFKGQIYSGKLNIIEKTGEEIKQEIKKYLLKLVKGTKTLSKLKKQPIDIEFTIANGILYWLQIRPITTGRDEPIIWDNTHLESNYAGQTLPLSISLVAHSFYLSYKGMAKYVGMPSDSIFKNERLFKKMAGEINGCLYYNVTYWQKLIYQLPFGKKISKRLPQLWGMEDANFIPEGNTTSLFTTIKLFSKLIFSFLFFGRIKVKYENEYKINLAKLNKIDFSKCTYRELIDVFQEAEASFVSNWKTPLMNTFFTAIFSSALKKVVLGSRLNEKHPNFVNDILFAQGDVISVVIVKEFQKIILEIQNNGELHDLFTNFTPEEIRDKLMDTQPLFNQKIVDYINKYGDRSAEGELKMETVNYKEDPLLFIEFLKINSKYGNSKVRKTGPFSYKDVLRKEYPYNFIKRGVLKWLIRQTIERVRDRENYRFLRTCAFSQARNIFRAIDKVLLKNGYIKRKNDSLYLQLEEIIDTDKCKNFESIIESRKNEYERFAKEESSNRFIQTGKNFSKVIPDELNSSSRELSGTGCCSGIVKSQIKIIQGKNDEDGSHVGKILVANYFEPGKINLFSQAGGIISIRGNLLSHTAILCREMGIPSIVGAKGLMSKIKDGDIIEMNGSTGKIKILTNE